MNANNQIQAAIISPLPLREAAEKAVSALGCLLEHGKNAPWQAWEKALNANTHLRQSLASLDADRNDAPDDVEVTYLVWAFQGQGSWTDATKEMYDAAKTDDRMAVVSLDAYLSKEKRTHPHQQAAQAAVPHGWKLVPVQPTPEMCKAAVIYANGPAVYKNVAAGALKIEEAIYGEAYAAMLSAAPIEQAAQAADECETLRYEIEALEAKVAELRAAQAAVPQGLVLVQGYERLIDQYIEEYEFTDGDSGYHDPSEFEQAMIKDAFMGFDFSSLFCAVPAPVEQKGEA